ncbi:MAG: hypothetical protein WD696_00910 [Bryobacteraceae bacterium]
MPDGVSKLYVYLSSCVLFTSLICGVSRAQDKPAEAPKPPRFFSGSILDISVSQITVTRMGLGQKHDTRTFAITSETRIEGKPEAKARATVRFVTKDQANHALDIVVRPERKR